MDTWILVNVFSLQMMLLDSSLQLLPPVLVIPSLSDVLLVEAEVGSPYGELEILRVMSVTSHIDQILPLLLVGQQLPSQLGLGLGLEQVLLSFTSTLSGTATLALNGTLVECFGPANNVDPGNRVDSSTIQILGTVYDF